MKRNKPLSILTAVLLLAAMLVISAFSARKPHEAAVRQTAATASQAELSDATAPDDVRGVWITYMELSMAYEADKSEAAFRKKFEAIAADCKAFGFNTLIVQVRPFCDALYDSKLFPASHILTGEQGKSPGFDALKIMCAVCRAEQLSLHAWVNPYRVTAGETPSSLSANNPYKQNASIGLETESGIILDPSNEEARRLITDGVKEIVENYDVDGVQFDDYFYPTDIGDADSAQYQAYLQTVTQENAMDLAAWRKANVSLLMAETHLAVHRAKPQAVFGISPQGNLGNNEKLYADVKLWCGKKGYIDYICPQLYFSTDNPALPFETALNEWQSLHYAEGVKLYAGLAGYKAGSDADDGTWQEQDDILRQEYSILKENKDISGILLYSYVSLHEEAAKQEMEALQEAIQENGS